MDKLKTTYKWTKWIVFVVMPKAAKWLAIAYVAIAVIYTTLKIDGSADRLPFVDEPNIPAEQMTYGQWVNARAEWLKEQGEFKDYMDSEAESVVNMKASDVMRKKRTLYKYGADATITSTTSKPIFNNAQN